MTILAEINKNSITNDLTKILDKYSSKKLTTAEIQNLYDKEKRVQLYLELLEIFKKSSSSNEELFIENFTTFIGASLKIEPDELNEILGIYFLSIASHIPELCCY